MTQGEGALDILAARRWPRGGGCLPWGLMEPLAVVRYGERGEGVGNRFAPQSLYPYRWSHPWTTMHELYVRQRLEFEMRKQGCL